MAFFGAFSNSLAAFILPSVFTLKIRGNGGEFNDLSCGERVLHRVIVVFGLLALAVSTVFALKQMVDDFQNSTGGLPAFQH